VIIGQVRKLAHCAGELGDDGTNDLVVSEVLRRNELQAWFLSEHLVDARLFTPSRIAQSRTGFAVKERRL
jgi:starvation-inducible DNA-binding protein